MISRLTKHQKIEYGDFQTPRFLAEEICSLLIDLNIQPRCIIEPTCGIGNFLIGAVKTFTKCSQFQAIELNKAHVDIAREKISKENFSGRTIRLKKQDFFDTDWDQLLRKLPQPFLVIGNPPWVTNTALGSLDSVNLPQKSNFHNRNGFEAISGKSNFDISEWMLLRLLTAMQPCHGTMAMLCKTSVARKVLQYGWNQKYSIRNASLYLIDAKKYFNVNVDACLFVCKVDGKQHKQNCTVYQRIRKDSKESTFGLLGSELVANIDLYKKHSFLDGPSEHLWRSGIKHDCARVMEFEYKNNELINGLGESCDLEPEMLYSLYKSSDVFNGRKKARKHVLITQTQVGQDTAYLRQDAPKTWQYLTNHADQLEKRKSRIYLKNPRFSIFGIGEYSFAPWKIAISGLYKKIHFSLIGPDENGKPCMVDDTCYFIPCGDVRGAELLFELYSSDEVREFLEALIFWDSKRPVTTDILRRINIRELAKKHHKEDTYREFTETHSPQMTFAF